MFSSRGRTKPQCARKIGRECLLVRLRRGFERDFDCVAGIKSCQPKHTHLQNEPALRAARRGECAPRGFASIASEH